MDLLRFITAGNVDDGKSTLIGRLLYDSKNILVDQMQALEKQSKNGQSGEIDLALLTDGLRAEREQGITIDVAYKYFSTSRRKFIIADAPGHIQYTRNMITGASNADLIIILVDARHGVAEQTRRHSIIASLLNIPHVVVAVNKMDLVGYSQDVFNNIVIDYSPIAHSLGLPEVTYIPLSALKGDNIVEKSARLRWYDGQTLLDVLETVHVENDVNLTHARFPVQYVIKPQNGELADYRGYAGKIISGKYRQGETITVLPSGEITRIKSIAVNGRMLPEAFATQSVVMELENDLDVSRGDMFITGSNPPLVAESLEVLLCWMDTKTLREANRYVLQINSRRLPCMVEEILYKLDVNTLVKNESVKQAALNDIVKVRLRLSGPVAYDRYGSLRANGGAILIDQTSNVTVGACMIQ